MAQMTKEQIQALARQEVGQGKPTGPFSGLGPPIQPLTGHEEDVPIESPLQIPGLRQGLLPGVGTAIGSRFGTAGQALGGMAGEAANQALGITEPSMSALAAQGESALATGPLTGLISKFAGGRGAETLNRMAPEAVAQVLGKFDPLIHPRVLFEQASKSGAMLNVPNTMAMAKSLVADLNQAGQTAEWKSTANYLQRQVHDKIAAGSGQLSAADVLSIHQGLGDKIAMAQGKSKGALQQVYKRLGEEVDDLISGQLPSSQAAQLIQQGWREYKRMATINELRGLTEKATKAIKGTGDAVQFNGAQVVNDLKKNRFFDTAFDADEKKEIIDLYQLLNKIPSLRPGAGQQYGFGREFRKAVVPLTGGAIAGHLAGQVVGTPEIGAEIGGVLGLTIPPVVDTLRNFGIAMQTKVGRQLVRQLITGTHGELTPKAASVLAAYATANLAQPGAAQAIQGQGTPTMGR